MEEETLGDLLEEISYDQETGISLYAYHNSNYHITIKKGKPVNYDEEINAT